MTDALKRFAAPISQGVWTAIDGLATSILRSRLSARTVVDFNGPLGWDADSIGLGRTQEIEKAAHGKPSWGIRQVLPIVEVRMPFVLSLVELENLERGAKDVDLMPLENAAKSIAAFEESAVYLGLPKAGILGILSVAQTTPQTTIAAPEPLIDAVAAAMAQLRENDIQGPFAFIGGTKAFALLNRVIPAGGTVGQIIEQMTGMTPAWTPVLEGAAIISARGGDYALNMGQDIAIGYEKHDSETVSLFFTETFTFQVIEPRAAVEIRLG